MTIQSHPTIYADGMGKISYENGVVKIDFVALQDHYAAAGASCQKVPVTTATMVLSPAGFEQALKTMQNMASSIEKERQTNIKKQEKAAAVAAE